MLPIGVRARQLLVRTLLLGMVLVLLITGRPDLTRVHQALTALPEDDQRRLGVITDGRNGPAAHLPAGRVHLRPGRRARQLRRSGTDRRH